jgi:hypothetical protein
MQYDNESKTETFAGAGDRIMAGKPCENCNCGKKELFEGAKADGHIKELENGAVESACGKFTSVTLSDVQAAPTAVSPHSKLETKLN